MRIAFILPYVPGAVRPRPEHLVRQLVANGHDLTVFAPWFVESERRQLERLCADGHQIVGVPLSRARRVWNRARAVARGLPTEATLCWIPGLAGRIDPERFDVAHVEHARAAPYGLRLLPHLPVVWDAVDALHLLARRARAHWGLRRVGARLAWDAATLARHEAALVSRFRHVTVTSPVDRDALLGLARGARPELTVLPNGVHLERFRPDPAVARNADEIVMTGRMSYHANVAMAVHFADAIFPRIRAERPGARLRIVGRWPPPAVLRLGERPGIEVVGAVDELRPHLCRAALAVAPVPYGVGVQNKVLEAMACATPVVASPQAASALTARPDEEIAVEATPEGFARRCVALLADPAQAGKLGRAGRRYVEREHAWPALTARLEQVYERALSSRAEARARGAR